MSSWYPSRADLYSGNFVERFARLLSTDYDVTVLFSRSENRNDIEMVETKGDFRTIVVYHPGKKDLPAKMRMQRKAAKTGFQKITKPVDLIFAHISWPKGMQFIQAKKHFGAPLLLLEHGSYYRPDQTMPFFQKMLVRKCLKAADATAAVSDVLKADILRQFPNLEIEVIPNPVNDAVFHPQSVSSEKKLIHISTLDKKTKHPEKILEAIRILKNQSIFVPLHIVSDQPFQQLQLLCKQLEIEELVTFAGSLSEQEISAELNKSLALVVSSSYETFGIVIAEAWLCGKPVISTSVGIASQLDKKAGIQAAGTPQAIADGIRELLSHPERFDEKTLVQFGKPFSFENVRDLLNKKIKKLAGQSNHHR